MAWHDDGEWILAERLADVARQQPIAQFCRYLAVGDGGARLDRACDLIDPAMEIGDMLHIERSTRKIAAFTTYQRDDVIDDLLDVGRRCGLAYAGESPPQPRP